tara:strand:- start:709 stop:1161 length:453 start_codon:yes stop_codon:yes gene_type:complete
MSTIQVTNINDLSDNAALVTDNGGIKTDKLTGKTTAGSISVVGEGNSTTTNLQQGLCKAWADAESDASRNDSLNIASGTDNGTGDNVYAFTNPMNSALYVTFVSGTYANCTAFDNGEQATTSYTVRGFSRADSLTNSDHPHHSGIFGDLA